MEVSPVLETFWPWMEVNEVLRMQHIEVPDDVEVSGLDGRKFILGTGGDGALDRNLPYIGSLFMQFPRHLPPPLPVPGPFLGMHVRGALQLEIPPVSCPEILDPRESLLAKKGIIEEGSVWDLQVGSGEFEVVPQGPL